jgi:hypothetical protein
MITLQQNTVNSNIILTLSENVTLTGSPVYFLFRFIDETTNVEKIFSAADTSTNIERFNNFTITLTGASFENLTGGTINLPVDGKLKYEAYEMYNPSNLALSGTSGVILETGLVQVSGSTNMQIITNSYSGQSNTYNTYLNY